ncbi:MAG: hypothetical protein R6V84_08325 [Desulfobacterales bacterium]
MRWKTSSPRGVSNNPQVKSVRCRYINKKHTPQRGYDMNMPANPFQSGQFRDRRARKRSKELTDPMLVISLHGGPLYQLKVRDLSDEGAGIVARADSNFLQKIEIGQVLKVNVVLPRNFKGPSGHYQSRVEHITAIQEGPFAGHMIIGLAFLNRITVNPNPFKKPY